MIYIVSGVSGSGKSTVGKLLAQQLGLSFYDGDDYHPSQNIEKMAGGNALTDDDRFSWLTELSLKIIEWERDGGAVLACSALKEKYRRILESIPPERINWIILHGKKKVIEERMKERKGHFFNSKLLDSQFEIFEMPDYGWHFDILDSVEDIISQISNNLKK